MFRNYLKIALRNILRNKALSVINIGGLAIGIATCLLIMLYVKSELSYDRYNHNANRIVRVVFNGEVQGQQIKEANVMPPVAQTLLTDYPEVQQATRLMNGGAPLVTVGEKTFSEKILFADSNFLEVFTLPLLEGDKKTCLQKPNSIVITRQAASKFFGEEDPIGKMLEFRNQEGSYIVTGLIEDVPPNSHFQFDLLGSLSSIPDAASNSWMTSNYFTYLVLPQGYDYLQLQAKMPAVIEKYMGPQLQQSMGVSLAQFRKQGNNLGLRLQPLTDIHLHSDFTGDLEPYGDIRYVYLFSAIALFMLLIACINFMNLSTASASKRAMEVGIRKVVGSGRTQLIWQFLTESVVITALALLLSTLLVQLAMPLFNQVTGMNLHFSFTDNPWMLPALLLTGLVTGVIAGSYPAFYLSSFNPVKVIKGKFINGKKSSGIRSGLVVFQFFISITLIVGTMVVYKQLSYIRNMKLGYDKNNVLVLPDTYLAGDKETVLRQKLASDSRVENITSSGYLPAGPSNGNNFFLYPEQHPSQIKTIRYEVDYNYLSTLGMKLSAGRNFSKEYPTDSSALLINETAATTFGWANNALDKTLRHFDNDGSLTTYHVVGVVSDFHFKSLHQKISPLVMTLSNRNNGTMIIKSKNADVGGLLAAVKNEWQALNIEVPFTYSFLDERYNSMYKAEQNSGLLMAIFSGLTIFIACLGLFGLAAFTAEQRTKEIGIRKVLGASVGSIISLLTKHFLQLVVIALLIASPIAWFIMNRWLQDYAYRINLPLWVFAAAAILVAVISLISVSVIAFKAAVSNPVKSLRTE